jgi:predicted anti-sigma-YlaC factor YlaD
MSEEHLHDDALVTLAIGDANAHEREAMLRHLDTCAHCRRAYDDLADAVEQVLPAAPRVEPSPGFDARVLDAIGVGSADRRTPLRWRLAVAAAVGLLVGAGGTYLVTTDQPSTPAAASSIVGSALTTAQGTQVGTVTRTSMEGRPVAVLTVAHSTPGAHYRCRLRLADGRTVGVGDWTFGYAGNTWVVPLQSGARSLELVNDAGLVWASTNV